MKTLCCLVVREAEDLNLMPAHNPAQSVSVSAPTKREKGPFRSSWVCLSSVPHRVDIKLGHCFYKASRVLYCSSHDLVLTFRKDGLAILAVRTVLIFLDLRMCFLKEYYTVFYCLDLLICVIDFY